MSWPIAMDSAEETERTFDFRLRDATDKLTPEDVTVGDITLTVYYPDGTSDTLSTTPTKISGSAGLYRGVFTGDESAIVTGNGTVIATCTGCDPELIPVTFVAIDAFREGVTVSEIIAAEKNALDGFLASDTAVTLDGQVYDATRNSTAKYLESLTKTP